MKKIITLAALIAASVGNAWASDSVDLKVTGKLATGACTPQFQDGGVIDMGHIPTKNLNPEKSIGYYPAQYQHKKMALDITCSTEVSMGFTTIDNKAGTVPSTFSGYFGSFGLGKTADDKDIGLFQLYENQATIDDVASQLLYSSDGGVNWHQNAVGLTAGYTFAFAKTGESTPLPGKKFHLLIDTMYYFEKSVVDNLTDALNFEGTATFNMVYL